MESYIMETQHFKKEAYMESMKEMDNEGGTI